jgi:hypothetical protein
MNVQLVPRASLTDKPDLILDPESCILLYPLAHLPSAGEALLDDICRLSWSYTRIVIVFEAYSEWKSFRSAKIHAGDPNSEDLEPYPFSPPVIKAVRTLRRGLGLNEGSGTKDVACGVSFCFARNVDECVGYIRSFGEYCGNMALRTDEDAPSRTTAHVWDDRGWLTLEEWEVTF